MGWKNAPPDFPKESKTTVVKPAPSPSADKPRPILALILLVLAFLACGVLLVNGSQLVTNPAVEAGHVVTIIPATLTPQPTSTAAPTVTPQPTSTPIPTATPQPTSTAIPTATPQPTSTAIPTATPQPTFDPAPLSARIDTIEHRFSRLELVGLVVVASLFLCLLVLYFALRPSAVVPQPQPIPVFHHAQPPQRSIADDFFVPPPAPLVLTPIPQLGSYMEVNQFNIDRLARLIAVVCPNRDGVTMTSIAAQVWPHYSRRPVPPPRLAGSWHSLMRSALDKLEAELLVSSTTSST